MIESTPQYQRLLADNRRLKGIVQRQRQRNTDLLIRVKSLETEAEMDRQRVIEVANRVNQLHVDVFKTVKVKR